MKTKGYLGEARIFTNGGSQAVRLPAACRFQSSSVTIHKLGRLVILQEPQPSWDEFFHDRAYRKPIACSEASSVRLMSGDLCDDVHA